MLEFFKTKGGKLKGCSHDILYITPAECEVLLGREGKDWNYLVSWPPYWRVWASLNRN